MKMGRIITGDAKNDDHWVDAIGYLALGVEQRTETD